MTAVADGAGRQRRRGSEHPLGEAIVRAATERALTLAEPRRFEANHRQGVRAEVEGRRSWSASGADAGQAVHLNGWKPRPSACKTKPKPRCGSRGGRASAVIASPDTIKDGSAEAVRQMHDLC